jgi:flagellar biosynthesis chaperone FliJ
MLTQRIQVLEQQVESRDKELDEIREAYQSKVKKCTAWEKVRRRLRKEYASSLM